jgi:hypothetical protein
MERGQVIVWRVTRRAEKCICMKILPSSADIVVQQDMIAPSVKQKKR